MYQISSPELTGPAALITENMMDYLFIYNFTKQAFITVRAMQPRKTKFRWRNRASRPWQVDAVGLCCDPIIIV